MDEINYKQKQIQEKLNESNTCYIGDNGDTSIELTFFGEKCKIQIFKKCENGRDVLKMYGNYFPMNQTLHFRFERQHATFNFIKPPFNLPPLPFEFDAIIIPNYFHRNYFNFNRIFLKLK